MASRMTISSLLCDDDGPRPSSFQQRPSSSSSSSSTPFPVSPPSLQQRPHPQPSLPPVASKSSYIGLDALVHAATEERRRISSSSTESDIHSRTSPQADHRALPPPFIHHPRDDDKDFIRNPPYRHRVPERPHRMVLEDPQVHLSHVEDLHHRQYLQSPPSRHLVDHEQQQRIQQQELERQRQRQHHEQLLLQEHQQHQMLAHERKIAFVDRPPPRGPSMPLQLEVPKQQSPTIIPAPRKSDPAQLRRVSPPHLEPIAPPLPPPPFSPVKATSPHPSKRRRYSDTLDQPPPEDQDRLHRERETMITGGLGYGRVEALAVPASTRRPGSGSGRKHIGVADLITPSAPPPAPPLESMRNVISPAGRRSPPGSQEGRAKAARKSGEAMDSTFPVKEHVPPIAAPERGRQLSPGERREPKEEKKKHHSRPISEAPSVPPPKVREPTRPPTKAREDDPHEWFLEHYDEYPPAIVSTVPPEPPRPPSPAPLTIPAPLVRASKSPAPKKLTPTPITMPEAAVALEQELEGVVAEPLVIVSKVEPDLDMDVDLAVTELVVETLESGDPKVEDIGMEDVEDELLSLLDDRPSAIRRSSSNNIPLSVKPPPARPSKGADAQQPSPSSALSAASPSGLLSPAARPSSTRSVSERGSMPPPATVASARGKDKETDRAGSVVASAPKKKGSKLPQRPKATPVTAVAKPRTKAAPKTKPRNADAVAAPASHKLTKPSNGPASRKATTTSRSRSASVMPGGSAGPEMEKQEEEEEEEEPPEDDKLYCVCKTKYDEDRFMIACDRCDEWYHTQCVSMSDLEVDLVDQFICPPCVEKNPHLSLQTTYKKRCLFGLKHPDSDSPKACHKPARGAFSKYCSDECGVKFMQTRIDTWTKKGGKKDQLWESIKDAEKREGVVVYAEDIHVARKAELGDECKKDDKTDIKQAKRGKAEREMERLNGLLDQVVKLREEVKKGMEVVIWREKLLELATERAEQVGQCGWDQRLCFGDEEWADFGAGVLESYADIKAELNSEDGKMQIDGTQEDEGEWWCPGKTMCDRHAGWQTVRHRDIVVEKTKKEDALQNLTTREREIRKRIEDIIDPQGHSCNDAVIKSPLKASNTKFANGHAKGKVISDTIKKGKKRKAPS